MDDEHMSLRLARYSSTPSAQPVKRLSLPPAALVSLCCCARIRYNCPSWSTCSTCWKGCTMAQMQKWGGQSPSLESQWHPSQSCQQDLHRKPCLGRIWPRLARARSLETKISALAADTPLGRPRPMKCAMRHPSELLCCCRLCRIGP